MDRLSELKAVWSQTTETLYRQFEMCSSVGAAFGRALRGYLTERPQGVVYYFDWSDGEPSDRLPSHEKALLWNAGAATLGVSVNLTDRRSGQCDVGYLIRIQPLDIDRAQLFTPVGDVIATVDRRKSDELTLRSVVREPIICEVEFEKAELTSLLPALLADVKAIAASPLSFLADGHGRKIRTS